MLVFKHLGIFLVSEIMSWTNGSDYDAENDVFAWEQAAYLHDRPWGMSDAEAESQESDGEESCQCCTFIVNGEILETQPEDEEGYYFSCERDDWPGSVHAILAEEDEEIEVCLVHSYSTRRRVYFTFEEVGYQAEEEGSDEAADEYGPSGYLALSE